VDQPIDITNDSGKVQIGMQSLKTDPLISLRQDPRYPELLKKMRLPN